jgi:hypothetical protein
MDKTAKTVNLELQNNDHQFSHAKIELGFSKNFNTNVKISIIPIKQKASGFECQITGDLSWKYFPLGKIERYNPKAMQPFVQKFEQEIASKNGEIWAFIEKSLQEYKLQLTN